VTRGQILGFPSDSCHHPCSTVCIRCVYLNVNSADSSGIESVLSSWREKSAVVDVEYDLIQSILIQRCTLARLCTDVLPPAAVKPQLYSVFEDWAAAARKAGRFQVCCSFLVSKCLSLEKY